MTATGARSPAVEPPPQALVTRFAEALTRLWPEEGKLGLAVSGGPDSLAMLLLAEAAIPGRFEVGTVDHGLRAESAGECAMVADVCAARGIPCEVLPVTVHSGNLQAMARVARYAVLAAWAEGRGLSAVATGHHADDQAETLLMRLNRGSGVAGLAGVREVGPTPGSLVPVVRPLLGFRRDDLIKVIEASDLSPVQDSSNVNDRFERARIRKAIATSDWLDPLALSASASHLADADEAIDYAVRRAWSENATLGEGEIRYRPIGVREINLRAIMSAIQSLGKAPRGQDGARLLDRLEGGKGGNLAGVLATVEGDEWVFRAEPPRRTSSPLRRQGPR